MEPKNVKKQGVLHYRYSITIEVLSGLGIAGYSVITNRMRGVRADVDEGTEELLEGLAKTVRIHACRV